MSDALTITGLCKNFGALAVSNGAGKTTLINMITGALDPSSGRISYFGRDITAVSQAERARNGLLRTFQVTRVFRPLTVADNIRLAVIQQQGIAMRFFLDVAREPGINARVEEALAMLDLEPLADRRIEELAYGERRLVEMALALAGRPRVLLLDEPAAGVPKSESSIIMRAIGRLPTDLAILFIEHDMDLVFRFAEEIVVLVAGEIMTVGTPAQISADERVKEIYFGRRQHANA
jgi:branched-chain amino acid transport system ATP-binding protein